MDLIAEHNRKYHFFVEITGVAMKVYNKYHYGLLDDDIIVELKSIKFIGDEHRKQLQNYLNITHIKYGMLINFSPERIYSEWYERDIDGSIERIKLF